MMRERLIQVKKTGAGTQSLCQNNIWLIAMINIILPTTDIAPPARTTGENKLLKSLSHSFHLFNMHWPDKIRADKHTCVKLDNPLATHDTHTKYLNTKSKNAASDNGSDVDRDSFRWRRQKQEHSPCVKTTFD